MEAPISTGRTAVLFVANDAALVQSLTPHLRAHGFRTEHEPRGDTALTRIHAAQPDAILLGLRTPGKDLSDLCHAVRASYHGVIIALAERGSPLDHVLALESGADDYLAKPVDPRIVVAHLRAALRRGENGCGPDANDGALQFGTLRIDMLSRSVTLGGREAPLTGGEFDLLRALARRAGEVVSRADVRAGVRGLNDGGIDRWMDMRVSRLRRLLDDNTRRPRRIKTVRGRGYLFNPTAWN